MKKSTQQELASATDESLIASIASGDAIKFETLMRRYNQRLYRVSRSIVNNDAEAEDVVQDTYVAVYRNLSQFERRAQFSTWITRIAVHHALARVKRLRPQSYGDMSQLCEANTQRVESRSPEDHAASSELGVILKRAVERLPGRLRSAYVMRYVEGLSTSEVAECLRISLGNVKVRLHRARELLRELIDEDIGIEVRRLYQFAGARCDRIVSGVMKRLGFVGGVERVDPDWIDRN